MSNDPATARPPVNPPAPDYCARIAASAAKLDGALADIRRAYDAGEMTAREAADNRIAVMEIHLAELHRLREQYLA